MRLFDFELGNVQGSVRELAESDLPVIVAYWHESPAAYLQSMGVDLQKLSSRDQTEAKFRSALSTSPLPRSHVAMAVDLGSRLVAYTNAYVDEELTGHAHVHVLDPALRRGGLGTTLFRRVLGAYFGHYRLSALVFQTHPDSTGINRLLQSFGLLPRLVDDQSPSGMARAGLVNQYRVGAAEFLGMTIGVGGAQDARR